MILDFKATVFFGKPYLEMSGEKPSRDGRSIRIGFRITAERILDFKATVFFGKPYLEMSGEKPSRDGRSIRIGFRITAERTLI